ncbi:adhesive plaque matrix protein-like isoform X2 [Bradysia coprophila]|uniref:adhesive plaque matrix protein-like isoform X2 n=1 Tax=Bradysia coprophila TaxID=38358 RepID=UPI00187D9D96|nr:adhesive plaque matrix protein-like isoform X2 [Bradysia coprophila]
MKYLLIACIAVIISQLCDAHEYLYDQDDSDLSWLYDNQIYANGYYGDFDDYVPNSYRKSVQYPPIVSYDPRPYYVDDWNDDYPVYLSYESLPRIQKKPVYFRPPPPSTTQQPSTDGYYYPAPQSKYLPPNKEAIPFAPARHPVAPKKVERPDGYHYPAPETKYLPPSREPVPFVTTKKPEVPKAVYLPPKALYLPPTRRPTTATPKTTTRPATTRTTTTSKPSTPKSLYLPPIIVPEPSVVGEYLPPPRELAHNLQPPPISGGKPILFN